MSTFIEEVALRLYTNYGDKVSSLVMLMPSKRARLFFAEALSKVAVRPLWEPEYSSIDDLMITLSGLKKVDRLRLIAELHTIYKRYHKVEFDEFYHWGEVLISDFDMIDKYKVDAHQLFANISDQKELESDLSYLSAEQIAMINRFWQTLTGKQEGVVEQSKAKSNFLEVWRSLGSIYDEFRARLRELGVGYMGMIYRDAVERLEAGEVNLPADKRYVFVGFNALSECERVLLQRMQSSGCAEFYWDYDKYYVEDKCQEAGMFIRKNLESFGESSGISHDNFRNIKSVNVLSTSSNVAQCQCVVNVLEKIASENGGHLGKDTAVVLTDENMLMPLLYALPEKFKVERTMRGNKEVERPLINVTMGYPLRSTLAYSFVERLLALQKNAQNGKDGGEPTFYHIDVDGLLIHPYVADTSTAQYANLRNEIVKRRRFQVPQSLVAKTPLLAKIFRKVNGWKEMSEYLLDVVDEVAKSSGRGSESAYRAEFLAVTAEALTKLHNVAQQCDVKIEETIYRSLVRRHLQAERVPFTGEPLEGLQIMGILETRNLDFKNVILLSMTDNNFPGNRVADKSFLPYGLRYGFNIPTAEHHEGVHAYYFYRLAERAENLYMLYSTASDDKSTGEPSRYIRQLEYETDFDIKYSNVGVEVSLSGSDYIEVEKNDAVFAKLLKYACDKGISPTSFSRYLNCPLQFYFSAIERLRDDDDMEESVDSLTFGNIFHEAADLLYKQIVGDTNPALRLKQLRANGEVEKCVDEAIATEYFKRKGEPLPELGGELLLIRNIVKRYLGENLMNYDIENNNFVLLATEEPIELELPVEANNESYKVKIAGRLDRMDSIDGGAMVRVIDYKTGAQNLDFDGINSLFHGDAGDRKSNIINTILYSMIISHTTGRKVRPELFYVGSMIKKGYNPIFKDKAAKVHMFDYGDYAEEFEAEVKATLQEMFNRSIPFKQSTDEDSCNKCDFYEVCNKSKTDY